VLIDFNQVTDNEWHQYRNLSEYLSGQGVPSIDEALREIFLQPVHRAFREIVNSGFINWLLANQARPEKHEHDTSIQPPSTYTRAIEETESKSARLLSEIRHLLQTNGDVLTVSSEIRQIIEATLMMPAIGARYPMPRSRKYKTAIQYLASSKKGYNTAILLAWAFTAPLGKIIGTDGDTHKIDYAEVSRSWIDEWLLGKIISGTLIELGISEDDAKKAVNLIKILVKHRVPEAPQATFKLETLLSDPAVQAYIGVNRHMDVLWFNKEAFEELVNWFYITSVIMVTTSRGLKKSVADVVKEIIELYDYVRRLLTAEVESGFQVEKLLEAVR
jgi:hypothetical protein